MTKILDLLPRKLISTEMASAGSAFVNGFSQIQILDNHSWSQIEVSVKNHLQIVVSES